MKQWYLYIGKNKDSFLDYQIATIQIDYLFEVIMSKEQERAELHRVIWRIAEDLRGSVDGWDFKAYVLGMLFYRFISENITAYINEQERKAGNPILTIPL